MTDIFQEYDRWAIGRTRAALKFLLESASVTQAQVECALIAAFVVFGVLLSAEHVSTLDRAVRLTICCITTACLYGLHRTPAAVRAAKEAATVIPRYLRLGLSGFFLGEVLGCAALLLSGAAFDKGAAVCTADVGCVLAMFYVIAVDVTGKPGRGRRLALEKLRELMRGWHVPDFAGGRV